MHLVRQARDSLLQGIAENTRKLTAPSRGRARATKRTSKPSAFVCTTQRQKTHVHIPPVLHSCLYPTASQNALRRLHIHAPFYLTTATVMITIKVGRKHGPTVFCCRFSSMFLYIRVLPAHINSPATLLDGEHSKSSCHPPGAPVASTLSVVVTLQPDERVHMANLG